MAAERSSREAMLDELRYVTELKAGQQFYSVLPQEYTQASSLCEQLRLSQASPSGTEGEPVADASAKPQIQSPHLIPSLTSYPFLSASSRLQPGAAQGLSSPMVSAARQTVHDSLFHISSDGLQARNELAEPCTETVAAAMFSSLQLTAHCPFQDSASNDSPAHKRYRAVTNNSLEANTPMRCNATASQIDSTHSNPAYPRPDMGVAASLPDSSSMTALPLSSSYNSSDALFQDMNAAAALRDLYVDDSNKTEDVADMSLALTEHDHSQLFLVDNTSLFGGTTDLDHYSSDIIINNEINFENDYLSAGILFADTNGPPMNNHNDHRSSYDDDPLASLLASPRPLIQMPESLAARRPWDDDSSDVLVLSQSAHTDSQASLSDGHTSTRLDHSEHSESSSILELYHEYSAVAAVQAAAHETARGHGELIRTDLSGAGLRLHLITPEFIARITTYLRQLAYSAALHDRRDTDLLESLMGLSNLYTQDELMYIRAQALRILTEEGFSNPHIANIIGFVYEWVDFGPDQLIARQRPRYRAVRFRTLRDVHESACAICYEEYRPHSLCIVMGCEHVFHARCLRRWLEYSDCCPYCRTEAKRG